MTIHTIDHGTRGNSAQGSHLHHSDRTEGIRPDVTDDIADLLAEMADTDIDEAFAAMVEGRDTTDRLLREEQAFERNYLNDEDDPDSDIDQSNYLLAGEDFGFTSHTPRHACKSGAVDIDPTDDPADYAYSGFHADHGFSRRCG